MNPEQLLNQIKNKIKPDEQFRSQLRLRLVKAAYNKQINQANKFNFMNMNKMKVLIGLTSALAVALVAIIVQQNLNLKNNNESVRVAQRQGFGKLPSFSSGGMGGDASAPATNETGISAPTISTREQSGGTAPAFGSAGDIAYGRGGAPITNLMIAPDGEYLPPKVTYNWTGEMPEIEPELWVFRNRPLTVDNNFMQSLYRLTGLEMFSNLNGAAIENVSIIDRNSPYRYNIEQGGRFNIWSNKQYDYREIQAGQVPPDSELISIAENFLRARGINPDDYGEPYIEDFAWARPMPLEGTNGQAVEDVTTRLVYPGVTVNYPANIDGKPVVYWDGRTDPGLSVNINVVSKEVTNVNGRWNFPKDQSLYPASSQETVIQHVSRGGLNALWGSEGTYTDLTPEQEARRPQITVNLSEVKLAYVQQYKYMPDNGSSEIYWIPVWAFFGQYTDQNGQTHPYGTIVPAIESNLFEQPPFRIMPAVEPKE